MRIVACGCGGTPTISAPDLGTAAALHGRWSEAGGGPRRLEITMSGPRPGTIAGDEIRLVGRIVTGPMSSIDQTTTLTLHREGDRLRGTLLGPRNVPVADEFERAR